MSNNLTYREKFTCEMIWGGIPTDTEFVRGSSMFKDGLTRFDKGEWVQFEKEVWKDVVGYEGLYMVSNLGRVKSLERVITVKTKYNTHMQVHKKEKLLTPTINNVTKYYQVGLCIKGKPKTLFIHIIVTKAFLGEKPIDKKLVNHKDGNKCNNNISNLEYCTYSENTIHSYKLGLQKSPSGVNAYVSRLTKEDVLYIRNNYNPLIRGSASVISRFLGVHRNTVIGVVTNMRYKND